MRFLDRLKRKVKVEITCGCGDAFIPAVYRLDRQARFGCRTCGMTVRLTALRGDISW